MPDRAAVAYVLATYPEVEEKMIAEIDGITGGDPDYDLQYDDLFALTYTTQVIKETPRIYPPQPVTIRRSLKDGTLGRYRVRKDDIILVTLAAQRDPRYWGGPDPGAQAPAASPLPTARHPAWCTGTTTRKAVACKAWQAPVRPTRRARTWLSRAGMA